jgi:ribose/xylose/arabinose/galactoside ABC-type transport system permease subunit
MKTIKKRGIKNFIIKQNGAVLAFVVLWILAFALIPQSRTIANLLIIIRQSAVPVIGALGMMFVLMTGGIDLSVGYTVGFSSAMVGIFLADSNFMYPVWVSILLVLLIGGIFGLINGLLITKAHIPPFITTMGMGFIIFGLINIITNGNTTNDLPKEFVAIGKTQIFGIQSMVYIAVLFILIAAFLLNKTVFGRSLISVGLNKKASYLSGLKVNTVITMPYIINGLFGAVAGILLTIRVNCGQPDMGGSDFTFESITAAVIGGTSLFGGIGSVVGCIFGVLLVKLLENSITILNVTPYLYNAVLCVIILGAIIFDNARRRS